MHKINNIGGNKIGNKTELIGELLQSNRNPLRMLHLELCEIEDEGGNIILEGLKQNNTLKSMDLGNKLTNIDFLLIVYLLIYIYIDQNKISEGLKEEFDALAKEREIEINLEDHNIDNEDEYEDDDEESEEEGEVEGGEDSEDEDQDEEGREEEKKGDCNQL